jgi:hypothetical protein
MQASNLSVVYFRLGVFYDVVIRCSRTRTSSRKSDTYSRGNGIYRKDDIHMEDAWFNESEVEYAAEEAVEM